MIVCANMLFRALLPKHNRRVLSHDATCTTKGKAEDMGRKRTVCWMAMIGTRCKHEQLNKHYSMIR